MAETIVICMRDPDASNEYRVFGGEVAILDIDYGYADLRDPGEFAEWADSHLQTAESYARSPSDQYQQAAIFIRELVAEARGNYGHS